MTLHCDRLLIVFLSSSIGTSAHFLLIVSLCFQTIHLPLSILNQVTCLYMSGEHWVMIAKFKQQLYFADSLGGSCNFLKQDYQKMVPVKLQSHPSVCGFYAIYSAFHLFKFQQEQLTGVHDVNVLSFISNYM